MRLFGVLTKKRRGAVDKGEKSWRGQRQRLSDMSTAKERTESPGLGERRGTDSPSGFQKETPLLRTPGFQASHLQNCARMHFSHFLVIFK